MKLCIQAKLDDTIELHLLDGTTAMANCVIQVRVGHIVENIKHGSPIPDESTVATVGWMQAYVDERFGRLGQLLQSLQDAITGR